ncbi:MAG: cytochrome c [Burkholderiales bacterium]|nr:cytochrome c [Burkholderiales bacterium]
MLFRRLVALPFALVCAFAQAGDGGEDVRARNDYLLHCSGCHGVDGTGKPQKGIPRFTDQVGYFVTLPEGRAFLMQVPGLMTAGMSDARNAAVTTWLVKAFAGPSLSVDFKPYTVEEAKQYRASRPVDITARRNSLYAELLGLGFPVQ